MKRSAFISPLQMFALSVIDYGFNYAFEKTGAEKLDIRPVVLSTLIQSGLDHLLISKNTQLSGMLPSIRKRIKKISNPTSNDVIPHLRQFFPTRDVAEANGTSLFLWAFMVETLNALRLRKPVILFVPTDAFETEAERMDPRIGAPIASFVKSFESVDLKVAAPTFAVSTRNAAIFESIVCDSVYDRYLTSHSGLEDSSKSLASSASDVALMSRAVRARHRMIRIESVSATALTITAKLIDTVLGGLPGKIGEELAKEAEAYLQNRQRLIVYKCSTHMIQIYLARLRGISRLAIEPPPTRRDESETS